jgi:hypothetical protein
MLLTDVGERRCDAVEERLRADEAVVGEHVRAVREVFAGAEADFKVKRTILAEQPL